MAGGRKKMEPLRKKTTPPRKKIPRRKKKEASKKVCDWCGALNEASATECVECGKSRWAPEWVLQLRRINRSFAVQVTRSHPSAESKEPRLTLYKWWPGNRATFNITRSVDWERVKDIVDTDLSPFLGWRTTQAIRKTIKEKQAESKETDALLQELAASNPRIIAQLVKGLESTKISDEDVGQLGESIAEIAEILVAADETHRLAIREIVKKLPGQGKTALHQLSDLMEDLTLGQITAVTSEVKRRAGLLELFRDRVLDERTYEITGDGSIHRLLEQAMWIVDERYWLMHSNRQLRTVVGNALAKEDKKFEKKRPDFVCGTVDKKLIVIEIKRPSHVLTVDDLN